MRGVGVLPLLLLACAATHGGGATLPEPRATSVRGWNSYNGWGGAVNETVLMAVADFMQVRAPRRRELAAARKLGLLKAAAAAEVGRRGAQRFRR